MGLRQSYTKEFQNAIVSKVLNRGDRTIAEVCEQEGINKGTVSNWLKIRARVGDMPKQKSSRKSSAEYKLKTIIETHNLSDEELGRYLRKEGLHSHQLTEWRAEIVASLNGPRKSSARDERDGRIVDLEREVARKDKALAEASALLILQKKVDLIWGKKSEEKK